MKDENYYKKQLQQESQQAFEYFFKLYHNDLCNYIYKYILDKDEAEEIVQQCFVNLWDRRSSASTILAMKAYLYKSAYNIAMNYFKHEKIKQRYASEAQYYLQSEVLSEFENTYIPDVSDDIKNAVENLPEKNKEVFKLRFYAGLNTVQVSEKLGITPRTVETHVSNAYKILREKLKHLLVFTLLAGAEILQILVD